MLISPLLLLPSLLVGSQGPAPTVDLVVTAQDTTVQVSIPGGLQALDLSSVVMRIDGSSNVFPALLQAGPPLVTVTVDPQNPNNLSLIVAQDLRANDLYMRLGTLTAEYGADWYLGRAAAAGPLGLHLVKEDFQEFECTPGIIEPLPPISSGLAAIRPGWARVNAPKNTPAWQSLMADLTGQGTQVMATLYVGTVAKAPMDQADLDNIRTRITDAVLLYGSQVDAWQLENELTINSKWSNNSALSFPSTANLTARGEAYAAAFQILDEVLTLHDPSALRVPFGMQKGGVFTYATYYLPAMEAVYAPDTVLVDQHWHTDALEDFEVVNEFNAVKTTVLNAIQRPVEVVLLASECSTWEGDPTGPLAAQTGIEMARNMVNKQLALRTNGTLFTCYGPFADRPCRKSGSGAITTNTKFTLNGHYYQNQGGPKLTATVAERVAQIARGAGWTTYDLVSMANDLERIDIWRADGTAAGVVLAVNDASGPSASGSSGGTPPTATYTVPAGGPSGVLLKLITSNLGDAGQLVLPGQTIVVDEDAVYIEWLD